MQAHSVHGAAALLFLFFFVLDVDAVCRHCWGTIAGCPGGPNDDRCTTITGAAANAAALATGATAALTLVGLLPVYLLRVFTPRILATLATVARRGGGASPYDFSGKDPDVIIQGVADRVAEASDAIVHLGRLAAASGTTDALRSRCLAAIKVIEALGHNNGGTLSSRVDFGKYLYIFGMCQHVSHLSLYCSQWISSYRSQK